MVDGFNMPRINLNNESPYKNTPQTNWYMLPLVMREIPESNTDKLITITPEFEFRPRLLANAMYGDGKYWWVFMVRNMDKIRDPINDFKTGLEIWVPSKHRLTEILTS
jgi:hypothetical protein